MKKVLISILTLILCVIPVLGLSGCDGNGDKKIFVAGQTHVVPRNATREEFLKYWTFSFNAEKDEDYLYTIVHIYDPDDVAEREKQLKLQGYEKLEKFDKNNDNDHRYKAMYYTFDKQSYDYIKQNHIPLNVMGYAPATGDEKGGSVVFSVYGMSCEADFWFAEK